ncbi:hypothetical protein QIH01_07760 [Brevibacillus brevis]|nr:hypothetical protein QIH01_07760 [Brevibacillus brevis]
MSKFKSAKNLNQKGLAVAGLTSSTVADDTHTEDNQGASYQHQHNNEKNKRNEMVAWIAFP